MRLRSRCEAFESDLGVDTPEYAGGSEGGCEGRLHLSPLEVFYSCIPIAILGGTPVL